MSAFDLTQIVESLQSTRLKSRNDALALLDGFSVERLRLTPLQLASLVAALLKAIEAERDALTKSSANLAMARAASAAYFLRDLVQASLRDGSALRPRPKTCTSLISSIASLYYVPSTELPFAPCTSSFAQTLCLLFEAPSVATRLGRDAWLRGFHFLLKAIAYELEFIAARGINENLIGDLFAALFALMGGSLGLGVAPLLHDHIYLPLLPLLTKTLAQFSKRESAVLVTAFKIINHLLVLLATEDAAFVHQLIRIGTNSALQFADTSVTSLMELLLVFLNTDSFHMYLSLARLPKLVSVRPEDKLGDAMLEEDPAITCYNLEMLIYALINRLNSLALCLLPKDVGLQENNSVLDWLHFSHMYLRSENTMPWLLASAISRLIASFYRLNDTSTPSMQHQISYDEHDAGTSSFTNSFKRQKLQGRLMDLRIATTCTGFYSSLIEGNSAKLQKCGLQLLTFHSELYKCSCFHSDTRVASSQTSTLFNSNEPTISDANSHNGSSISAEWLSLVSAIINVMASKEHSFWGLLLCRSLLTYPELKLRPESTDLTKKIYQMLKLLLEVVNDSLTSQIACSVFSYIIASQPTEGLKLLLDHTILNQLESVAELSVILGPAQADRYAISFWKSLAHLHVVVGQRKRPELSEDIAKWVSKRWKFLLGKGTTEQVLDFADAALLLLLWFCGYNLDALPPRSLTSGMDFSFSVPKSHTELNQFITLESGFAAKQPPSPTVVVQPNLEFSAISIELILKSINSNCQIYSSDENYQFAVSSFFMFVKLAQNLKNDLTKYSSAFEDNARNIILSLTPELRLKDQVLLLLSVLLLSEPTECTLQDVAFPFEIIDYHFRFLKNKMISNKKPENGFEAEFHTVKMIREPLPGIDLQGNTSRDEVNYFRFLAKYESSKPEVSILYMAELSPFAILECLSYYLRSGLFEKQKEDANAMIEIVRLIGEKLLAVQDFDRSEITIDVSCSFLEALLPLVRTSARRELENDISDLLNYFFQCAEKELIVSVGARIRVWKLLLKFTTLKDQGDESSTETVKLLLRQFSTFSNNMKISVADDIHDCIFDWGAEKQLIFLDNLESTFDSPQSSIESFATFCLFFAKVTTGLCLEFFTLGSLLNYSRFTFSLPYIGSAVERMAENLGHGDKKMFFRLLRHDILKAWWIGGRKFFDFPFNVFGYSSTREFISENSRYMTGIIFSTRREEDKIPDRQFIIKAMMEQELADEENLIYESMPVIIGMSYTSEGIRSEVFGLLKSFFQGYYKKYVQQMLHLIVSKVIQMTDVKCERSMRKAFKNSDLRIFLLSLKIQHNNTKETIDPSSSVELISALIKTFWCKDNHNFWSLQTVCFFVRQIGLETYVIDTQTQIYDLRRLQFLLLLSNISSVNDFHLLKLVTKICIPMMNTGYLTETQAILSQIDFVQCQDNSQHQVLSVVFKILASILSIDEDKRYHFEGVCISIERLTSANGTQFGSAQKILEGAINFAKSQSFEVTLKDVESFLSDQRFETLVSESFGDILIIVSKLLSGSTGDTRNTSTHKLSELYLKHRSQVQLSEDFQLWITEHLAEYFLSGLASASLEDTFSCKEYSVMSASKFMEGCKTLNPFLHLLIETHKNGTYVDSTFIECAIGTLIHTFETEKKNVIELFDFETCYEYYSTHVLPLNMHTFSLLSFKTNERATFVTSVELFMQDFERIVMRLPFRTWTCQLLLSLILESCQNSTLTPILARCVLELPNLASGILPSFFCFYVFNVGDTAISNVRKFFQGYWKSFNQQFCQESVDLIKDTAITIRMGAMQKIEPFQKLYRALDHKQLFQIVRFSHVSKSALMFFEDSLLESKHHLNWTECREPLAKLYNSLNDEDSLAGISGDATLEGYLKLRQDFLPLEENLRYSSGFLDASLILNKQSLSGDIIKSLLKEGYLGASKLINQQSEDSSLAEWSWKLSQWDQPINEKSNHEHDVSYAYFKQVQENPQTAENAFCTSMLKLMKNMPESPGYRKQTRNAISATKKWLGGIALLKTADSIIRSSPVEFSSEIPLFEIKTKWFENADSQSFEDILLARRLAFSLHECNSFKDERRFSLAGLNLRFQSLCQQGEVNEIVRYNNLIRERNMPQKAMNACILLEKLVKSINMSDQKSEEDYLRLSSFQTARTLWTEGKMDRSVALLKNLAGKGDISFPLSVLNVSKMSIDAQLAVYLAESRLERGENILDRLVEPMKSKIDQVEDTRQRYQIYHLLAQFCELQFRSPILKEQLMQLETRVHARKEELQELKSHYSTGKALTSERSVARAYYENLKSMHKSESKEVFSMLELKTIYAHNAAEFYLKALNTSQASDEDFEKFFSLFLELSGDEVLQASIQKELFYLPSHQPLAWSSQILSRVSREATRFQESIQKLLFKICCDHPFHTLYYLTSLLFHEKLAKETDNVSMVSRIDAASKIRSKLIASSLMYASEYLLPVEKLCTESILLAELKSPRGRTLQLDKLKIGSFWINELPQIPPPTLEISVSVSGYRCVPKMLKIDPRVSIASSGISLPKVATFTLSDGTKHKMLLKHGTDDLRQDAIMEQVFEKVNKIFQKEKESRRRKLRVRTYRAVPLGPKAGVIEFVPDSKALFEVILPHHQAMDSMKLDKARELMKNHQTSVLKDRLQAYQIIEEKIQPVLRYFFLSNFATPDSWFASRQVYIRGVATSSIVGHILGLGDRHCNNILLDEFTGEPIHIDLGVAFDQGKRLKVPETVPFRLTRDIVDGFGYMGCAGSFTKVSEHTFRVLRASKDHIMAILDVLRWDPLYSWSISPIRQKKLQDENAGMFNAEAKQDGSAATKAILGVSDKLNAGGLNVEAAVRELIREAVSETNLATIYCGWCPFY